MPLDITEYETLPRDASGVVIMTANEPARANQQVAIGGASAQSGVFDSATKFLRLHTDAACRLEFGVNPVASAASRRMAAGATEYVGIRCGGLRVAVITTT